MKKSIFVLALFSFVTFANAAWYSTNADGLWSDASTWKGGAVPPSSTDTGIDLYNKVVLNSEVTINNMYMKPTSTPTYVAILDGGLLTLNSVSNDNNVDTRFILETGGTLAVNGFGSNVIVDFAGGKLKAQNKDINTNSPNVRWTFGANDRNGNFVALSIVNNKGYFA